jgi:hypothetical protein
MSHPAVAQAYFFEGVSPGRKAWAAHLESGKRREKDRRSVKYGGRNTGSRMVYA